MEKWPFFDLPRSVFSAFSLLPRQNTPFSSNFSCATFPQFHIPPPPSRGRNQQQSPYQPTISTNITTIFPFFPRQLFLKNTTRIFEGLDATALPKMGGVGSFSCPFRVPFCPFALVFWGRFSKFAIKIDRRLTSCPASYCSRSPRARVQVAALEPRRPLDRCAVLRHKAGGNRQTFAADGIIRQNSIVVCIAIVYFLPFYFVFGGCLVVGWCVCFLPCFGAANRHKKSALFGALRGGRCCQSSTPCKIRRKLSYFRDAGRLAINLAAVNLYAGVSRQKRTIASTN